MRSGSKTRSETGGEEGKLRPGVTGENSDQRGPSEVKS